MQIKKKHMPHKTWILSAARTAFFLAIIMIGLAVSLTQASAKNNEPLKLSYSVYASGLRTLSAETTINFTQEGTYKTQTYIETAGLLGSLAPWQGLLSSEGRKENLDNTVHFIPKQHFFNNIWRSTPKITTQDFDEEGQLQQVTIKEGERPIEVKKPEKELTQGAVDILTATLIGMDAVQKEGNCNSQTTVFDGKRRFNLHFKPIQITTLKSSRYNSYDGKAYKCRVEVEPISGKWRDKPRGWMSIQEQSKEKGHPPTIWFGEVLHNGQSFIVPVKLMIKTNYGTLVLHLKSDVAVAKAVKEEE
jgi:hypothetical protein